MRRDRTGRMQCLFVNCCQGNSPAYLSKCKLKVLKYSQSVGQSIMTEFELSEILLQVCKHMLIAITHINRQFSEKKIRSAPALNLFKS